MQAGDLKRIFSNSSKINRVAPTNVLFMGATSNNQNISRSMKPKTYKRLSYDEQKGKCTQFVRSFEDYTMEDPGQDYESYGRKKYMIILQKISNNEENTFEVLFEDLESFFMKEEEKEMVSSFHTNTNRYMGIFTQIADQLMPQRKKAAKPEEILQEKFENILRDQRLHNMMEKSGPGVFEANQLIPVQTHKNYDVVITFQGKDSKSKSIQAISQLAADQIGALVKIKGIVLRATQVKPELVVATYTCDVCGCENYVEVIDQSYKPLDMCTSRKCTENKVKGKLSFLPGHSKFRAYQELKIQETPDQLVEGSIPKTITLKLKGNKVKSASPGDVIIAEGILLPTQKLKFHNMNDLAFYSYIDGHKIIREKKKYVEMSLDEKDREEIQSTRANMIEQDFFDKLAKSIHPEIYGMDEVKKALLLLMVGGITKETHDKLRIRGEINIALIGDPGIAKSQLLKRISRLAPRGIYTTGKGSSGVGLTAAVVTDPNTKEISLQAGALILADMGVCCIDEFDKMDEYDRTAIHEVMEQQTVSIAKAGITTTLNARSAILAAANPLYGRYNKKQTPHKNINMPAALLSRFDLIFILLDDSNPESDLKLAMHIGKVHQNKMEKQGDFFEEKFLRNYIAMAKTYEPTISESLAKEMTDRYIQKRNLEAGNAREGESYTTPRSLLALVRLCQARARLRFSNEVSQSDFDECSSLLEESQRSITIEQDHRKPRQDNVSQIFTIIKDMCTYNNTKMTDMKSIEERVLRRGFKMEELACTIKNYQNLNVLLVNGQSVSIIE